MGHNGGRALPVGAVSAEEKVMSQNLAEEHKTVP
jgi:hypothetical protein